MMRSMRPIARMAMRVTQNRPPLRFSSGFEREARVSELLSKEIAEEGNKGALPNAPSGWSFEDKPSKIEMTIKRDSGETSIFFTAVEDASAERNGHPFVVLVDKPNAGTVAIKCVTDPDHLFTINQVAYYKDSKLAHDTSATGDWAREESYEAPTFATLDEDLQGAFHEFVQEHGVDSSVTTFIETASQEKEQKEYEGWLKNVKKFMDAPY